jgi:ATP sulfurylase
MIKAPPLVKIKSHEAYPEHLNFFVETVNDYRLDCRMEMSESLRQNGYPAAIDFFITDKLLERYHNRLGSVSGIMEHNYFDD